MTDKRILVIDIGGISVKLSITGDQTTQETIRGFPTPALMTPGQLLEGVNQVATDWNYDVVSIGYPGPVKNNHPWREPVNLGKGWIDYDYEAAFGCPVRMINDAAMQALGSYRGDDMLFLGLGTGLGTAMIMNNQIIPLEAAHLPFREGRNFEQVLGKQGLDKDGQEVWFENLLATIKLFSYVFCSDYVVLGGGNANRIEQKDLPDNVYLGSNDNAFTGGILLWADQSPDHDIQQRYAS
ncbi:MAG: ROK family protein [Gammaproteobacteria bacterium]|nr:ROK family protein [Gammaproteobacteria bacterium]